jgi:hypothetical protein
MKSLTLSGIVITLCFAVSADAHDLPSLASEGYCLEAAEYEGGNEEVYDGCIDIEKDAYKQLMEHWGGIPEEIKKHCVAVAMSGGESYSILEDCVELITTETIASAPRQEEHE